jgi:transcriptional regulator with XRE-family HTH domain
MGRAAASELPSPVVHALRKVGGDIKLARRRRRIPVELLAQRAGVARATLYKIEKGESGVAIGSYAAVLFSLGLLDRLADLADPLNDTVGLQIEEENLPKRIRLPRR